MAKQDQLQHGNAAEVNSLCSLVSTLKQRTLYLSFDDLRHRWATPSGVLSVALEEFNFFLNFECGESFLKLLNFSGKGKPGEKSYCDTALA